MANKPKPTATVHEVPGNIYNQQAVKQLENGQLPGYSPGGKTGLPREMAPSSNPNAMAEDFVKQYIGKQKYTVETIFKDGKPFGTKYVLNDGTKITYRPAGSASNSTTSTTATVEINNDRIKNMNVNNNNPITLKLKFPRKTEVKK